MKANIEANTLYIIPETDLVASRIEELRDDMIQELENNPDATGVILDVQGIDIVDSLGVNLIIGLYRQVTAESKTFEIIGAGDKFMKVANFFRFPTLFTVKADS